MGLRAAQVGTALRGVRGERSEAAGGGASQPVAHRLAALARRTARSAVPTRSCAASARMTTADFPFALILCRAKLCLNL